MKILFTAFLFCTLLSAALAQHPDDYRWDDRFGAPGIYYEGTSTFDSPVKTIALDGEDVYVGGLFSSAGNNIAVWNLKSKKWRQLGSGVNGTVEAIAIQGNQVYVGGAFTEAGGVKTQNVAVWNTSTLQWSALGSGVNGAVLSMEFYKGELHIAGAFSATGDSAVNCIAKWSAGEWKSLGEGIECGVLFGMIECMTVFQNTLWIGGTFEVAGGKDSTNKLAFWDGSSWNKPQGIFLPQTYDDIRDIASVGGTLFVSGTWDSVAINSPTNTVATHRLLAYNGVQWSIPIQTYGLSEVIPVLATSGQYLYVTANRITEVNGILAQGIARWNSATNTWSSLGSGVQLWNTILGLAANDTILILGGRMPEAGGQFVNNIASYDFRTSTWSPLAGPSTLAILTTTGDISPVLADVGGLITVGDFIYAGDTRVNGIARWNGTAWKPMGSGLPGKFESRTIYYQNMNIDTGASINAVVQHGTSILLGGDFYGIGQTKLDCLAEYKDGVIKTIGGGISGANRAGSTPGDLSVQTLLVDTNLLYVGGEFRFAGNTQVSNIASWDGKQWNDMAGGVSGGAYYPIVSAIRKAPNGDVYVGGVFTNAGGVKVNGIARWDGKQWHPVGSLPSDNDGIAIRAITFIGNDLYVAGSFQSIGGTLAPSIAKWDGKSWTSLGSGIRGRNGTGFVHVMRSKGDELYVGGEFDVAGDVAAKNIAVWNIRTQAWSSLGSGVVKGTNVGTVNSIVFQHDTVFCGGTIVKAGGKPSFNIASWLPAKPNSVEFIGTSTSSSNLIIKPNPASSSATLTFSIPQSEHVTITLRDPLGREVLHISEGELQAGEYQTQIDCSALASGVYYCVMTGSHSTCTQLMVINR